MEGVGYWTIDTTATPLREISASLNQADVCLKLSTLGLKAWLRGTTPGEIAKLGLLELSGEPLAVSRFQSHMFEVNYSGIYSALSELICDPSYVFMNNGCDLVEDIQLRDEDHSSRYNIALVHRLLGRTDVRGQRILDVGCGRGGTCSYIKRYLSPVAVTGVDLNTGNIAFCQRVHGSGIGDFCVGDATALPFADRSFDTVVNIESSHGYKDLDKFFLSVSRVLNKEGAFFWTDALPPERLPEVWHAASRVGFMLMKKEDITASVIHAMQAFRSEYRSVMRACQNSENKWVIDELIEGYEIILQQYLAGALEYWLAKFTVKH